MSVAIGSIIRAFYGAVPAGSATCNVYQSGTSTPVTLYSDAALTTPITNPATADSNGEFSFFVASSYNLRLLLKTSDGTTIRDIDPFYPAVVDIKGTTIASASTIDLGAATGNFVDISGTTTITALGTAVSGLERTVRFTGALTLTYNVTSLILPGAANITTAANDTAIFRSLGGGNWVCVTYVKANGTTITTGSKGADIASATTTDIGAATGDYVDVTGTTTITGLGTITAGVSRTVRFTGILTLTYNATSLILPGAANITTANGDTAVFRSLGSGNWLCISYTRANAEAVAQRQAADLASASTVNIGASNSSFVSITGTVTITAFDSVVAGITRILKFAGSLTLTHNATTLILPGAANIITAAGDTAIFVSLGSGNWLCVSYQKTVGKSVLPRIFTASGTYTPTAGLSYAVVEAVGGGGGSGGVAGAGSQAAASGGGGGGSYGKVTLTAAQIGASQTVTIGAAGAAGSAGANSGGTGGTTSLGSLLSVTGGVGSVGGTSTATRAVSAAGAGGSGTTGDLIIPGQSGEMGYVFDGTNGFGKIGSGGRSQIGAGGVQPADVPTAVAGGSYGGGASGTLAITAVNRAGAAGSIGYMIITEFLLG